MLPARAERGQLKIRTVIQVTSATLYVPPSPSLHHRGVTQQAIPPGLDGGERGVVMMRAWDAEAAKPMGKPPQLHRPDLGPDWLNYLPPGNWPRPQFTPGVARGELRHHSYSGSHGDHKLLPLTRSALSISSPRSFWSG